MPPIHIIKYIAAIYFGLLALLSIFDSFVAPYSVICFKDLYFLSISVLFFLFLTVALLLAQAEDRTLITRFELLDLLVLTLAGYLALRSSLYLDIEHGRINTTLTEIYFIFFLYYTGRRCLIRYELKGFIIIVIAGVTLFEACLGILQFFNVIKYTNAYFEIGGSFDNPAIYGNFLALVIPFLLGLMLYPTYFAFQRRHQVFLALILCLSVCAIILSMSRSSWIGTITGVSAMLCLKYSRQLKRFSARSPQLFTGAIAVGALLLLSGLLLIYHFKQDSSSGRLFIYKRSLELSAIRPVSGHGLNSFGRVYNLYQAGFFSTHNDSREDMLMADNINIAPGDYVQVLIELGIAGLMLVLGLTVIIIYGAIRNLKKLTGLNRVIQTGGIGAMLSIATCSLLSYPLHILPITVMLTMIISIMQIGGYPVFTLYIRARLRKCCFLTLIPVLLLLGYIQIRQYKLQKKWNELHTLSGYLHESALSTYEELFPGLRDQYLFLSEFGMKAFYSGNYEKAILLLEESNYYFANYQTYMYLGIAYQQIHDGKAALINFKTAVNIVPNRFLPKFYLFKFYLENGQHKTAKAIAREIMNMPVKVQDPIIDNIKEQVGSLLQFRPQ